MYGSQSKVYRILEGQYLSVYWCLQAVDLTAGAKVETQDAPNKSPNSCVAQVQKEARTRMSAVNTFNLYWYFADSLQDCQNRGQGWKTNKKVGQN